MATISHSHDILGDRYKYDYHQCKLADGWAQLDTRQDASYYGNWINPITLKLASYCEGDVTITECTDEADFITAARECVSWHQERSYFIGIDAGCSEPLIEAFRRMGLDEYLH